MKTNGNKLTIAAGYVSGMTPGDGLFNHQADVRENELTYRE